MTLAIVDYGSGNLRSASKAIERAISDLNLGISVKVTSNAQEVSEAERIVLPGVGAFGDCLEGLSNVQGMIEALNQAVIVGGKPFMLPFRNLINSVTVHCQYYGVYYVVLDALAICLLDSIHYFLPA